MISVFLGDYHYKFTGGKNATLTNMLTFNGVFISGEDMEQCNKSNEAIEKLIEANREWLDKD